MIHQSGIPGSILFVGAAETFSACQDSPLANATVTLAAEASRLPDLDRADAIAGHAFVLFETAVSDADLRALGQLVIASAGRTKFVAIVEDSLPLARARLLSAAGAAEVVPAGITASELSRTLARLGGAAGPEAQADTARKGQVVAIAQTRGGAGATTVAVNLAVALATPAKRRDPAPRVLLIDLDLQFGNAGTYLDVEDNGQMLELITRSDAPDADRLAAAVQSTGLGVDVLVAPSVFVPLTSMTDDLAERLIEVARHSYDYVLLDLPHATLDWMAPVIASLDRLVLVSDTSVPCVRQARRLLDLFREAQAALPVDLLINREKKPVFTPETVREAQALLEMKVTLWVPEDRKAERRAVDLGRPSACRRTAARRIYRRYARTIAARTHN